MRKRYTAQFKAEVARELLREDKPLSRIAAERQVAPTQLNEWKTMAVKGMIRLFEDEQRTIAALKDAHEDEKAELYAEIGRLTTQLTWLKQRLGMD
jgi:transposase-like protein